MGGTRRTISARARFRGRTGGLGRRPPDAGVAAMELGMVAPVLVALCMGIWDFGRVYMAQLQLSTALASGTEFAFAQGQSASGTALTTAVQSFVQTVSPVSLSTIAVSYNNGLGASNYYCVSGAPATYTLATSSTTACADGSMPGKFVSISGSFTFSPLFAPDQFLLPSTVTQSVVVRVQ
jgi:Flp pilus assembly protein TadG